MIVGQSPAINAVREQIDRVGPTSSTVLITGESGTGKELVARALHAASPRRDGSFIPINCAAIPETLLESQLFGHVKGAFTGAVQAHRGLFVAADGGTLFLDEVAELTAPLQGKLLRAIDDREIRAVGGTVSVQVDVRLIAATNRDIVAEVAAGRFREDLYYRLNVARLRLPALRERRGDLPLLVAALIEGLNARLGMACRGVDEAAMRLLDAHAWPGNVRELENLLERAMVMGDGDVITVSELPEDFRRVAPPSPVRDLALRTAMRNFERQHIRDVLRLTRFDMQQAATLLGISLASLYRKLGDV